MVFNVENGKNVIDILSDGFVTCLKIKKPVAVDWPDCDGSCGRYFSFFPHGERMTERFNETMITGEDSRILEVMCDFMELFTSGEYTVYIDRWKKESLYLHRDLLSNRLNNYYNPLGDNLMFTQRYSEINPERVKEYEAMILSGLRPKAVIFEAVFEDIEMYKGSQSVTSVDSPQYILDGHHKLLAYRNLGITPEFVRISKERTGKDEYEKNINLYFEYEYLLTNDGRQHIISHTPKLLTDDSPDTKRYNRQFDLYLQISNSIETDVLELFKKALDDGGEEKKEWLLAKLRILRERNFPGRKVWLYYYEKNWNRPAWNGMYITSQAEFDAWIPKMFGIRAEILFEKKG
ncbi:hypothetical protein D3C87_95350 [compost metagenome]